VAPQRVERRSGSCHRSRIIAIIVVALPQPYTCEHLQQHEQ
jgi:hypothetical protein